MKLRTIAKLLVLALFCVHAFESHAAPAAKTKRSSPAARVSSVKPKASSGAPRGAPSQLQRKTLSLPPGAALSGATSSGVSDVPKVPGATEQLEVLGQVRNLNMMLILHNRSEGMAGFELRKHYRAEIGNTNF